MVREAWVTVAEAARVSVCIHGAGTTAVVLGHGAGSTRTSGFLVRLAETLAGAGRTCVLFNFPYSETGRRVPDPPALLEATVAAVAGFARRELGATRLVLGGKSMGGRIASQAVSKGLHADALVFLGYPLHPPRKPEVLRDKHLPSVAAPMLFVQGTRDEFARADLLDATLLRLGDRVTRITIEDGDHSFGVRKRVTGKSSAEVEREIFGGVLEWLAARAV